MTSEPSHFTERICSSINEKIFSGDWIDHITPRQAFNFNLFFPIYLEAIGAIDATYSVELSTLTLSYST